MSLDAFSRIIGDFDGNSMPVKVWFENFDQNAEVYELTERQKYVHARNKMVKTAQLFLESVVCQ